MIPSHYYGRGPQVKEWVASSQLQFYYLNVVALSTGHFYPVAGRKINIKLDLQLFPHPDEEIIITWVQVPRDAVKTLETRAQ